MLVAKKVCMIALRIELNMSLLETKVTSLWTGEQHFGKTYLRQTRISPIRSPIVIKAAKS